jgi:hypothetical protein
MEILLMIAFCRHGALWALLTALCLPAALRAAPYSVLAFDNGTIQPNGPRPFSFGKNYFNMEGSTNNNFASFGVAAFNSSALVDGSGNMMPSTPTGLNAITLSLTQANASFTTAGALNFYLVEDVTTSIQPTDAAVLFDPNDPNGEGLNGQLAPVHFLGSGAFTGTYNAVDTSGTADTFIFPPDTTTKLDPATVAYVLGVLTALNTDGSVGGPLRVVITPADPAVAATYAGFSNTLYINANFPNGVPVVGPTITLDVSFN